MCWVTITSLIFTNQNYKSSSEIKAVRFLGNTWTAEQRGVMAHPKEEITFFSS